MGKFLKQCLRAGRIVYRCMQCGAGSSKLWRKYNANVNETELFCAKCACKHAGEKAAIQKNGTHAGADGKFINTIGDLIPAIPTAQHTAFWGVLEVPARLFRWWESLPLKEGDPPGANSRKPGEMMDLIVEYVKLSKQKKKAEERQEEIKDQIDEGLQKLGIEEFESGGFKAKWGESVYTDYKGLVAEKKIPQKKVDEFKRTTPTLRVSGAR